MSARPAAPEADARLPDGAWAQSTRLAFRFLFALVCLLAVGWALSGIRRVPADSRAVVLRLGSVVRVQGAGLVLAWPRPIEEVRLLPASDRPLAFRIARFEDAAAGAEYQVSQDARRNAAFLLTGDSGVVHLQATLFYRITDPAAFVIAETHVAPALERLFVASAVAVCAARDLDTILVARPGNETRAAGGASREQLRADLLRAVNRRLADLAASGQGLGLEVSRVDLAAALPAGAKAAFDRILTVTQNADQVIARARTYAASTALGARQESQRLLAAAEAGAEERRTRAAANVAPIAALAAQMLTPAGQVLRARLYNDRIGMILKRAREVDTVDPQAGARLILPGPTP